MLRIWYDTNEFDSMEFTGLNLTKTIEEFSKKATKGAGGKVFLHGTTNEKACGPPNPLSLYCTLGETTYGSFDAPFFCVVKAQSQQQQEQPNCKLRCCSSIPVFKS